MCKKKRTNQWKKMAENIDRKEIYSKVVRAGKRTYFFDVKSTRSDEYYLTITESKRKFQPEDGKFSYEKHKLFLYKEDFEKFTSGLNDVINFIKGEQNVVEKVPKEFQKKSDDISFEDLGSGDSKDASGDKDDVEEDGDNDK